MPKKKQDIASSGAEDSATEKSDVKKTKKKKTVIPSDAGGVASENGDIISEKPADGNKRLATEKHPTIEAVINGLFRFEKKEQAVQRLEAIKNYFVVSSKLPKDAGENVLKLWIRGFKIEPDEEKEGYLGNYAALKISETKDKKFTIIAEKQRIALKYHPQRKRPKRKHPDWGHPCMRIIKKKTVFETIEQAQKVLAQLHEEHPLVSIPAVGKLYVILYSKAYNPPIKKFILEIKTAKEGGFYIESRENNYNKDNRKPAVNKQQKSQVEGEEQQQKGYFASMVELRKAKKRTSSSIPPQLAGSFSNRISIPTSNPEDKK